MISQINQPLLGKNSKDLEDQFYAASLWLEIAIEKQAFKDCFLPVAPVVLVEKMKQTLNQLSKRK